jgi:hypothetical protein
MDERNINNGIHYFSTTNMTDGHAKILDGHSELTFVNLFQNKTASRNINRILISFFKLCLNSLWAGRINKCRNCLVFMLEASNVKIFLPSLFLPWSAHIGCQQTQKVRIQMSRFALSHIVPENVCQIASHHRRNVPTRTHKSVNLKTELGFAVATSSSYLHTLREK